MEKQRRDKVISPFRVNAYEKELIEKSAIEWHMTVSAYVRHAVMSYSSEIKNIKSMPE